MCPCEQFLYHGVNKELIYCPKCQHPRYKEDTASHLNYRLQLGKKNDEYNHTPLHIAAQYHKDALKHPDNGVKKLN